MANQQKNSLFPLETDIPLHMEQKVVGAGRGMGFKFFGNGAYCYANSASMLLSSIGEEVSPSTIEVLTGVGLGATWFPAENSMLFGNLVAAPDVGISSAMDLLGFGYVEKNANEESPLKELKRVVASSPLIAGPVDAGLLSYNPSHAYLAGVDHFVFVYDLDNDRVHLHDPEGFPNVTLDPSQFLETWKAEKIPYRRGAYRYWARPTKKSTISGEELFENALRRFRELYRKSDELCGKHNLPHGGQAFTALAQYVSNGQLRDDQSARLVNFAFPVSAKRSLDYADFFENHGAKKLASSKHEQAKLFGKCQVSATQSDWKSLSEELTLLARVEESFRTTLFSDSSRPAAHSV